MSEILYIDSDMVTINWCYQYNVSATFTLA